MNLQANFAHFTSIRTYFADFFAHLYERYKYISFAHLYERYEYISFAHFYEILNIGHYGQFNN